MGINTFIEDYGYDAAKTKLAGSLKKYQERKLARQNAEQKQKEPANSSVRRLKAEIWAFNGPALPSFVGT